MPTQIPTARRRELEKQAVAAWMTKDPDGVHAAVQVLFDEGTPNDALLFITDLVSVAYGRRTQDPDVAFMPLVGHYGPDGRPVLDNIDAAPLGVSTYARIAAAHMGGDVQTVASLFVVLLEQDTPDAFHDCILVALSQAAATARRAMGGLQ